MMKRLFMMIIVTVFAAGSALAAPANLAETGLKKCYDAAGVEIACTGTGQDGELRMGVTWPNPRFITNADTAVMDSLTALVWAPDGNVMPTRDNNWDQNGTVNDGMVTWKHALDYVAKLNAEGYLGHADWRLPNVNELDSLVHAGFVQETCGGTPCASNNAWLNTQGFSNVQKFYWSSTTYAGSASYAWVVNMNIVMYFGGEYALYPRSADSSYYYVWPVRGGQ